MPPGCGRSRSALQPGGKGGLGPPDELSAGAWGSPGHCEAPGLRAQLLSMMKPAESCSLGTGPRCKQAAWKLRGWVPPRIYLHDQRLWLGPPLAVSHQLLLPLPVGTESHGKAQVLARGPLGCTPPRVPCMAAPAVPMTLHGYSELVRGGGGRGAGAPQVRSHRLGVLQEAAGRGHSRPAEAAGAWRGDFPSPASPCCSEGLKFTVCAKMLQEINARKKKKKAEKKKRKSPSKRSSSSSAASSTRRHQIPGQAGRSARRGVGGARRGGPE